jgi:ABC-type Fe3+/spermidine/putrescine transport system ATPase subunit
MLEVADLHIRRVTPPRQDVAPLWLADGIGFQVAAGQTVAILGPSGSGKSTLLKVLAGLQAPDGGTVRWQGQDVTFWPPERRRFALMFQDFALFPHLNVEDNVAFGLIEQGVPKAVARQRARVMLAGMGLAERHSSPVTVLSGGEQQRVALARALLSEPGVLLLDEPFSALDADLRQRLRTEFQQRLTDARMACVLVTHDEAEARAMARQGYRLQEGKLLPVW